MTKRLFKVLTLMLAVFALNSCGDDDPIQNVEMNYILSCSEDLLKFVSPVVTYVDGDGTEKTITLSDGDWNKSGNISVGNESSSTSVTGLKSYVWTRKVTFNSFGVNGKISVKYIPLSNTEDTTDKQYTFFHDVSITATAKSEYSQNQHTSIDLDLIGSTVHGTAVTTYIEKLANATDTKTCSVDGSGSITVK